MRAAGTTIGSSFSFVTMVIIYQGREFRKLGTQTSSHEHFIHKAKSLFISKDFDAEHKKQIPLNLPKYISSDLSLVYCIPKACSGRNIKSYIIIDVIL